MDNNLGIETVGAPRRGGIFDFYTDMNSKARKTFWACFIGFALDAMDFMIFPLVIGTLIALWHMDAQTAGGIATVTLWASSLGGWLAGGLADRIGRVKTMQLTVAVFAAGSVLSAFAQNAEQLTIFRALLGLGFGGEAAVAAVTLAEVVSAKYRGRAMGFYASAYAVGWALAILAQAVVFVYFPPDMAWRILFAIGVAPGFLVFFVRRNVEEPAIAAKLPQQQAGSSIFAIFSAQNLPSTMKGALLSIGAQGGFYSLMVWMPQFLRAERNMTIIGSTPYLLTLISGAFVGYLLGGWLSDKIGRRKVLMGSAVLASLLAYVYTHVHLPEAAMAAIGFPLGVCACAYYSAVLPCLSELFPTNVRGAGVGFTYNAGRAVGGVFPFLVGVLSHTMPLSGAISLFALSSYGLLFVVAFLFVRETNGTELRA